MNAVRAGFRQERQHYEYWMQARERKKILIESEGRLGFSAAVMTRQL
jgi:hypothetical protein